MIEQTDFGGDGQPSGGKLNKESIKGRLLRWAELNREMRAIEDGPGGGGNNSTLESERRRVVASEHSVARAAVGELLVRGAGAMAMPVGLGAHLMAAGLAGDDLPEAVQVTREA
jgi:hypothetical protein